jgi:peptidylprolyl isomerase
MKPIKILWLEQCRRLLKLSIAVLTAICLWVNPSGAAWCAEMAKPMLIAALAQGNAITDPTAILRYSLPIDNKAIRDLQGALEDISNHLRAKRWGPIEKDVKQASKLLALKEEKILDSIPDDRKSQAQALLGQVKEDVTQLQEAVKEKDREAIWSQRRAILDRITNIEEAMVTEFPYEVPDKYANLPQLKGRAKVELETTQGKIAIVVDGYSAPVNAGNFVDLVQRGFYDGLPFQSTEDSFVVQTGDPQGSEVGFVDPKTKQYRAIPLEVLVKEEEKPIYENTLEDVGIYLPDLALPFNAYGAVALARPSDDANGGSSQFFFFKFDTELTPPGFNLMDGRYSVFGYAVEGKEAIANLTDKDKIISAKVVEGLENLVEPSA